MVSVSLSRLVLVRSVAALCAAGWTCIEGRALCRALPIHKPPTEALPSAQLDRGNRHGEAVKSGTRDLSPGLPNSKAMQCSMVGEPGRLGSHPSSVIPDR